MKSLTCLSCGTPYVWSADQLVCPKKTCASYNKKKEKTSA